MPIIHLDKILDVAPERELDETSAVLTIPARASRRAIALAVAELAHTPRPYVLDVLFS